MSDQANLYRAFLKPLGLDYNAGRYLRVTSSDSLGPTSETKWVSRMPIPADIAYAQIRRACYQPNFGVCVHPLDKSRTTESMTDFVSYLTACEQACTTATVDPGMDHHEQAADKPAPSQGQEGDELTPEEGLTFLLIRDQASRQRIAELELANA